MHGEVVLETRALSMHFGGVIAVDNVDFLLWERELRCLIGPNGAGKSTFFKCLTGQINPSAGRVLIRDHDITGAESHQIARLGVGIKTQVPNVFEGLSVQENIWLAARRERTSSAAQALTEQTLERLQLTSIYQRPANTLAHGQRQWLELGVVLAAEPWLILLDEPAAGMTKDEVARTAELIHEINKSTTLIVVDHDMPFIRMIADQITVFHQGTVLTEAPIDEVLNDPRVRDIYLGQTHV